MLNKWKRSFEGQWLSLCEELASEREYLASAWEEWETNLGTVVAKFDAGLVSLAVMPHQQQGLPRGLENGEVIK